MQDSRDGADQQRLGQAGHADQEYMPTGEQAGEQVFDHRLLADDHPGDLVAHPAIVVREGGDRGGVAAGRACVGLVGCRHWSRVPRRGSGRGVASVLAILDGRATIQE